MKTENAIAHAGSPRALAELLGITPSAVCQWGDELPQAREWQLRVLHPEWFTEDRESAPEPGEKAGA
jgi:transcriptional repressor of cell division inhibition gene dicB